MLRHFTIQNNIHVRLRICELLWYEQSWNETLHRSEQVKDGKKSGRWVEEVAMCGIVRAYSDQRRTFFPSRFVRTRAFTPKGATIRLPGGGLGFFWKKYSGSGFGKKKYSGLDHVWKKYLGSIHWKKNVCPLSMKRKCLPSSHEKKMSALYIHEN